MVYAPLILPEIDPQMRLNIVLGSPPLRAGARLASGSSLISVRKRRFVNAQAPLSVLPELIEQDDRIDIRTFRLRSGLSQAAFTLRRYER